MNFHKCYVTVFQKRCKHTHLLISHWEHMTDQITHTSKVQLGEPMVLFRLLTVIWVKTYRSRNNSQNLETRDHCTAGRWPKKLEYVLVPFPCGLLGLCLMQAGCLVSASSRQQSLCLRLFSFFLLECDS